jgi:hypothetical protein
MDMTTHTPTTQTEVIAEQAMRVRVLYPELFDYLTRRDQNLRRALRRVPSPADIELSASWNRTEFIKRALDRYGPGIDELAS